MKEPPVDPKRLRAEFPEVTDEELQAYVAVTRRVLGDPGSRGEKMREVMERARQAQQKAQGGATLTSEDQELVRYVSALGKMQRSTVKKVQ